VTSFPQKKCSERKESLKYESPTPREIVDFNPKKKEPFLFAILLKRGEVLELEMRFHRMERAIATLEENRKQNGDLSSNVNCRLETRLTSRQFSNKKKQALAERKPQG